MTITIVEIISKRHVILNVGTRKILAGFDKDENFRICGWIETSEASGWDTKCPKFIQNNADICSEIFDLVDDALFEESKNTVIA